MTARDVRETDHVVHRSGVGAACHRADGQGDEPRARVLEDGGLDGRRLQPEPVVGGQHAQGVAGEPQHVERAADREVGLVARVDADPLEIGAPRCTVEPTRGAKVDVARDRERHEVGHDAAGGEHPPCVVARYPDEVDQPADDLLLHEGADRPGVPHVDPLLDPLRQDLATDGHHQGGRREVAERPGVMGVVGHRCDALAERPQHLGGGPALGRRTFRRARRSEEPRTGCRVGILRDRPCTGMRFEPIEGLPPHVGPEGLERLARGQVQQGWVRNPRKIVARHRRQGYRARSSLSGLRT